MRYPSARVAAHEGPSRQPGARFGIWLNRHPRSHSGPPAQCRRGQRGGPAASRTGTSQRGGFLRRRRECPAATRTIGQRDSFGRETEAKQAARVEASRTVHAGWGDRQYAVELGNAHSLDNTGNSTRLGRIGDPKYKVGDRSSPVTTIRKCQPLLGGLGAAPARCNTQPRRRTAKSHAQGQPRKMPLFVVALAPPR